MKEIRLLRADEIECRAQSVKSNGCVLLLYKDARTDMNLLDETFGRGNWQRTHEVINDNLFCNIDIWDESKKTWVRKQDVGVESNTEKQKGEASDSFKRAGFNVGIGRELYSAPFIWVNLSADEVDNSRGKPALSFKVKFHVSQIGYNDKREIDKLEIRDQDNKVRFTLGAAVKAPAKASAKTPKKAVPQPNVSIDNVLKQIEEAKTKDELMAIWKSNTGLQTNETFKNAMTARREKVEGK